MSDLDILDRIDDTLEDYDQWNGHSPDAARWADGEWIDARRPGLTGWLDENAEYVLAGSLIDAMLRHPQRVIFGMDPASQHVYFVVTPEVQPYVEAVQDSLAQMAQACGFTLTEWQRIMLGHWIDPALWDRAVRQPPRPMATAERTNSVRKRAGSRRTKRHARSRR